MRRAAGRVNHWDELSINRAGRKHSADFARVISRCRELKSIPDTENQKMISQGIISDILISAGGEQLEHRKLAHDKQPTSCRLYSNI